MTLLRHFSVKRNLSSRAAIEPDLTQNFIGPDRLVVPLAMQSA